MPTAKVYDIRRPEMVGELVKKLNAANEHEPQRGMIDSQDPGLTEDIIVLSGLVGLFPWIYVVLPLVFSGS